AFALPAVAAEKPMAAAPPAAPDHLPGGLGDVVGAVVDELSVDAEDLGDGRRDLFGRVVADAQLTRREVDERLKRLDVAARRDTDRDLDGLGHRQKMPSSADGP